MVLSKILKNFKEKYVLTLYFEKIFGGVYFEKIFDSWLLWLFFWRGGMYMRNSFGI